MRIDENRIAADIDAIAAFTEDAAGSNRPTFSRAWVQARDYVIKQARACGCDVRIDAAGNVFARPAALPPNQPVWLCGSHVDTVPNGGKYDGVVGVVVALEILRAAAEAKTALPLELVNFAEEEGTTFGLGMLGSRLWCGTISPDDLAVQKNRQGESYLDAGKMCGVVPERIARERLEPGKFRGMIEVHVEQGPAMWERNAPVAIVTAVAGRRQFTCDVHGVANHAGSTPMSYRRDALAAAAECVVELEKLPATFSPRTVLTVGKLSVSPGAINVIAERASFTIDFRSDENEVLDRGNDQIARTIAAIADRRGVRVDLAQFEHLPAIQFDKGVCDRLRAAAGRCGMGEIETATSGALHDAAIVAPFLPTAMVFVASKGGISHNPAEFSRIEDIASAARIVAEAVMQ